MNFNVNLEARIVKIIPVSVYQEVVYTQDIIVELENGIKLAVADPRKLCNNDFLNTLQCLKIMIYVAKSIEKSSAIKRIIVPASSNQEKYQGPHAEIYANVADIVFTEDENKSEKIPYSILDVGVGTIGLFLGKELLEYLAKGDYIRIEGARLDLKKIVPY